tara:strand:+ start:226 stop:393 length:168 start_codon:yes stop_codon:yes gene_type:complete
LDRFTADGLMLALFHAAPITGMRGTGPIGREQIDRSDNGGGARIGQCASVPAAIQ